MIKNSSYQIIDILKKSTHQLIGNQLGDQILPARHLKELKENAPQLRADFEKQSKQLPIKTKRYFVPICNGSLDTYEINPKNKTDFYVIQLMPNAHCYENSLTCDAQLALDLNVNILTFNYRGVNESKGHAERFEDLVQDCKAEVRRLIKAGVPANKIILTGFSLGAGVAAITAKDLHRLGHKVNVFCDRGFSSLTNEIVGLLREGGFYGDFHETTYRKFLAQLSQPLVNLTISASGWEANVAAAYEEIPDQYKEYLVVRSRKEKRNDHRCDDSVVPYYGSLHKGLKNTDKSPENKHRINSRKFETVEDDQEGHFASLSELHNRYGQSGSEFFKCFVEQVKEKAEQQEQKKLSV